MKYKYPDNVQIVEPRPGVYVLGDKLKIERYDDLNYVIKIKGNNYNDRVVNLDNVRKTYVYKSDGYRRYSENYFQSVSKALEYIVDKAIPALALDEDGSLELKDYIEKINSLKEEVSNMVIGKMQSIDNNSKPSLYIWR